MIPGVKSPHDITPRRSVIKFAALVASQTCERRGFASTRAGRRVAT